MDEKIIEQQLICTFCPGCQSVEEHEQRKHVDALVRLRETFEPDKVDTPEYEALCYGIQRIDWDNEDNEAPPANRYELEATLTRLRESFVSGTPQYDALSYAVTPPWSLSPVADCELPPMLAEI